MRLFLRCATSIVLSFWLHVLLGSDEQTTEKKRVWKQQCIREHRAHNQIFAYDGKNLRAEIRIANCIDLLTDSCIVYLKDICPQTTKMYPEIINRVRALNRTHEAIIKLGE